MGVRKGKIKAKKNNKIVKSYFHKMIFLIVNRIKFNDLFNFIFSIKATIRTELLPIVLLVKEMLYRFMLDRLYDYSEKIKT